ncbi:MAG TPA: four helix bundle protein [Chloroflexota bacterium]
MAGISCVEDIQAWQKARELTKTRYDASAGQAFARDIRLKSQIRAAAASAMSNIAEGFQRAGNKEFLQFLAVAKGSVGEVNSQLYTALEAGYLSRERFEELQALANDAERLIGGFMRYLRSSDLRGPRFK